RSAPWRPAARPAARTPRGRGPQAGRGRTDGRRLSLATGKRTHARGTSAVLGWNGRDPQAAKWRTDEAEPEKFYPRVVRTLPKHRAGRTSSRALRSKGYFFGVGGAGLGAGAGAGGAGLGAGTATDGVGAGAGVGV